MHQSNVESLDKHMLPSILVLSSETEMKELFGGVLKGLFLKLEECTTALEAVAKLYQEKRDILIIMHSWGCPGMYIEDFIKVVRGNWKSDELKILIKAFPATLKEIESLHGKLDINGRFDLNLDDARELVEKMIRG